MNNNQLPVLDNFTERNLLSQRLPVPAVDARRRTIFAGGFSGFVRSTTIASPRVARRRVILIGRSSGTFCAFWFFFGAILGSNNCTEQGRQWNFCNSDELSWLMACSKSWCDLLGFRSFIARNDRLFFFDDLRRLIFSLPNCVHSYAITLNCLPKTDCDCTSYTTNALEARGTCARMNVVCNNVCVRCACVWSKCEDSRFP